MTRRHAALIVLLPLIQDVPDVDAIDRVDEGVRPSQH